MPGLMMLQRRPASVRLALFVLLCSTANTPALAEDQPARPSQPTPADPRTIIVTAPRGSLPGVPADRSVDAGFIRGYGVTTIDELVNELAAETGEDEPVVIVNGQRIEDYGDVSDLPIEAVERVDILPRGSGARVGASPRGRVINIVLRRELKTAIVGAAYRVATDGGYSGASGEFAATRIQGPNRLNLIFRVRDDGQLLESDRNVIQPEQRFPYSVAGTIIPDPRTSAVEIDPVLSAAAGQPVTRAAIVPAAALPPLSAFVATAGAAGDRDLGQFRTLRPENRNYDLALSMVQRLTPWLTGSLNARLIYNNSSSLSGVASGLFVLPQSNLFSPFSRDVGIAAARGAPLQSSYDSLSTVVSGTLTAALWEWQFSLNGSYNRSDRRFQSERQDFGQIAAPIVFEVPNANPFVGTLGDLLIVGVDRSLSITDTATLQFTASGSPIRLPAGPTRLTVSVGTTNAQLNARNTFGGQETLRAFERTEHSASAIFSIPIASRRNGFLPELGEFDANLEFGMADVEDAGTLRRYSAVLNWAPVDWLRFVAAAQETRTPPAVESLADPVVVTPGGRFFDFLTGETVDVTQTFGGNPLLLPQTATTKRFGANAAPWREINLQLTAEYLSTRTSDFISSLPPASAAVLLAFPDRFIRDTKGVLTQVDVRPVNFERQTLDQLRYGLSFTVPIGPASAPRPRSGRTNAPSLPAEAGEGGEAPLLTGGPRPRLQVVANHTVLLNNGIVIREGLPIVDLLDGGAIGIAGGQPRHRVDFSLNFSDRGLGARFSGLWRSENTLELRQGGTVGTLRFAPLMTVNFTAFVEGTRVFEDVDFLRGTRFTFSVVNLANQRQQVTDSMGITPLNFQSAYRDPIGRTIEIGFRKAF